MLGEMSRVFRRVVDGERHNVGESNPTERVAYWTTEMMDVGTFKKVAPKEEEEGQGLSERAENGETPTTNGRTKTHGKRGMR